jgi:signal transduction histidine kinase
MKLIHHTLLFLSLVLFVTVSLWAVLVYYQLLNQVKTTIDEGLADYKIVLIDQLKDDSLIVQQDVFQENNFIIKRVGEDYALQVRDTYKDTLVYSPLKQTSYQTRLLTTAFVASDGNYYEMKLISQELSRGKLFNKIAYSLLWLYLFLFLSTIMVNNFVLKNTWKPFYQLLKYLNDFRLDRGASRKLSDTRIKEFTLLNESVQNLLKTNTDIYNSQKQFIENISHEMQTPLAIGINKLELLAGDENLSPDQMHQIGNTIEVLQRLSGLNKSLLLLTKIENKQFITVKQVNFDEVIARTIHDFSDFAEYQKIEIEYHIEDIWEIGMNKDLAEILVMNLVKNAIVHNQQGGEILIELSSASFRIENTGKEPGLSADKIFERFNKTSKSKSSSGLGLAIVKAIAEVSGLEVTYAYNGRHEFKISEKSK